MNTDLNMLFPTIIGGAILAITNFMNMGLFFSSLAVFALIKSVKRK
jgi:hypothetical protein